MTPEEFRRLGHRLIDQIADYRAGVASRPVLSPLEPGQLRNALPPSPPETGEPFEALLADIDRLIIPNLTHWQHPKFFGFFPANSELSSVLGDYASTGLGVMGLSWQACPPLTELEEVVTDWVRQMVGLSEAWRGVIQDTASTSTLVSLICARERTSDFALMRSGTQSVLQPMTVYASAQAHSSVEKAALLAGFGRENFRRVDTDSSYAMKPEALDEAIARDVREGRRPCAVVATTGTTTTTAVDPLDGIGSVAQRHGLWFHVDAAMAGSAMILEECRWMWRGVEHADSVVFNPHKWLGAAFDCSLYFVRDPQHLVRVMSTSPSYLKSAVDSDVKNFRDWGIPLGRRFRALKLWCLIRSEGVSGLQARLRRDLSNAQWMAEQVRSEENWRVLAPVVLQTVCLRHEPPGVTGEALDRHTLNWADAVIRSGEAFVTPAVLDGRWMVRVSIGALETEREDIAELWQLMRRKASEAGNATPE